MLTATTPTSDALPALDAWPTGAAVRAERDRVLAQRDDLQARCVALREELDALREAGADAALAGADLTDLTDESRRKRDELVMLETAVQRLDALLTSTLNRQMAVADLADQWRGLAREYAVYGAHQRVIAPLIAKLAKAEGCPPDQIRVPSLGQAAWLAQRLAYVRNNTVDFGTRRPLTLEEAAQRDALLAWGETLVMAAQQGQLDEGLLADGRQQPDKES